MSVNEFADGFSTVFSINIFFGILVLALWTDLHERILHEHKESLYGSSAVFSCCAWSEQSTKNYFKM